ncbi:uncharacterized protein LOC124654527 [Lolium rigidum]|uniref:uncharacterized protein LOC124654527 n=1 Tax=Lolium rigidum TaxID=89674 RepID=UPI001F5D0874|nr:uncharacterized protein LOC124654527 [Lolium rigidum]
MGAGARLKNVTVAECKLLTDVFLGNLSSLRSFRYSGCYMAADEIPTSSAIDDLYICFGGPACRWLRSRCTIYDARGRLCKFRGCWLGTLISLSNLTVLTVCSSALRRVSAKARARSIAGNAASCKLQNLREVQLLMFAMYNENFNDIMAFLTTCCTLRLERLFVQLPTRSYQYKPYEEPSESEEELSEAETSEEDLSKGEESEEDQSEQYESEEDHANGDESDEDGSEEDHSQEDHSEEDHSQEDDSEEDHPQEADSEEDHSQEGDSEENHSQEDDSEEDHSQEGDSEANHSQEDESEEDQPKENRSEEQGFAEGQSKEDGSKREFSDGGQPLDEPQNGCENLMLLKMTNFMGHHNEMRLVSFVLKKSACLNQLMLFTPESDYPGGPQKDHLNTSDFLQTKLLPLEKSSPNAQIILSEPDAAAIKPLHSETFVKV